MIHPLSIATEGWLSNGSTIPLTLGSIGWLEGSIIPPTPPTPSVPSSGSPGWAKETWNERYYRQQQERIKRDDDEVILLIKLFMESYGSN